MEKISIIEIELQNANKFREVFNILESNKMSEEHKMAYEEVVDLAKSLVESKNKVNWESTNFVEEFKSRHHNLSDNFIEALKRCVENYNPPVNLPTEPLW